MKYFAMFLASLFFTVSVPHVGAATDVNINIGLSPQPAPAPAVYYNEPLIPLYEDDDGRAFDAPPPLAFQGEPEMVVVPSGERYVYMVPNNPGLYFYGGRWYRYHRGYWYRSSIYNGSWGYVGVSLVPRYIRDVPPEYVTYLPPDYYRIHYREFNRGWRGWENTRHWHNQSWYRYERRDDVRRERYGHIRSERDRVRNDSGHRDYDRIRRDDRPRSYDGDKKSGQGGSQVPIGDRSKQGGSKVQGSDRSKQGGGQGGGQVPIGDRSKQGGSKVQGGDRSKQSGGQGGGQVPIGDRSKHGD